MTQAPMPKTTLRALRESIAHWKRLATDKRKRDERLDAEDCALCSLFNTISNPDGVCSGCPVYAKTGYKGCSKTPYGRAVDAALRYGLDSDAFRAEAQAELTFLQALLPKPRKRIRSKK